ncbi:hypothetical protein PQ459_10440 [Chryseobacterium sp. KACC 21268]|nr:hypothetical protein PQ459_10440 [Chryseobacterium sp. KACC 21268]
MNRIFNFIRNTQYAGLFIGIMGMIIYLNTVPNKWAVDDSVVIYKNQLVQRGIKGIPDIFTHDFMYGSTGQNTDAVSGGRWRPFTPAMYAVFSELLAKPAVDPLTGKIRKDKQGNILNDLSERTTFSNLMHLLNVLFYGLLCYVLYQFLARIFEKRKEGFILSFFAAAIFSVHPIHTEVVANVKGSDEILSLLFSMLSATLLFKAFTQKESQKWIMISVGAICFFLGALAKENTLMFVIIIPMTLWFFGNIRLPKVLLSLAILVLPIIIYFGLRNNAAGKIDLSAKSTTQMMNDPFLVLDKNAKFEPLLEGSDVMMLQNPSLQSIREMPYDNKLATTIYTFGRYLKLLIIPTPLTYDYYPRHIAVKSFSDVTVWVSLIINLGLLSVAVFGLKKKSVYSYSILFYFITFSVVSNLFFPIGTNMGERFMFMPSVGFLIFVSALIIFMMNKLGQKATFGFVGLVSVIYIVITVKRNPNWRDNLTLFSHDINVSTNSAKVRSDYGEAVLDKIYNQTFQIKEEQRLLTEEETAENINLMKQSLPYYKEALDIYPMYGLVWFNLARTNKMLGDEGSIDVKERLRYLKTSEAAYKMTYTYKPIQYIRELNVFKSLCYTSLGKLYGQDLGDIDKALTYLHLAEKTDPKNSYADFLLGTAYSVKGDGDKSFFYTQKAYNKQPGNRDYQENYALSLQKNIFAGKIPKTGLKNAEKLFLEVIRAARTLSDESVEKKQILNRNLGFLYENYLSQKRKGEAEKILLQLKK